MGIGAQTLTRVLVVSGSAFLAHNVATALWHAGYSVDIMGPWHLNRYRFSRTYRRYTRIHAKLLDHEKPVPGLLEAINEACRLRDITVVVPADVSSTSLLLPKRDGIEHAKLFPAPSYEGFVQLHNKWSFSQIAQRCGARHPRSRLIEHPNNLRDLDLIFPVIVKPLTRTFGEGVFKIETPEKLDKYIKTSAAANELPVLVQEFIAGFDMDLTMLVNEGKPVVWTIQRRGAGEPIVEFVDDPRIFELGERVVGHVNYNGIIDFDVRFDEEHNLPLLIEANPRFPGSLRFKLWVGVNFPALGVAMALGEKLPDAFKPPVGFCRDYGLSPKRLLGALLRGSTVPRELHGHSEFAWRMNLKDPLPNLLGWAADRMKRKSKRPWNVAKTFEQTDPT